MVNEKHMSYVFPKQGYSDQERKRKNRKQLKKNGTAYTPTHFDLIVWAIFTTSRISCYLRCYAIFETTIL